MWGMRLEDFKILITGSRHHENRRMIEKAILDEVGVLSPENVTIIHGNARGADLISDSIAREHNFNISSHSAKWDLFGKMAGNIRNQKMVDLEPDICLAFPLDNSIGTYDCIRRAKEAGIETKVFR